VRRRRRTRASGLAGRADAEPALQRAPLPGEPDQKFTLGLLIVYRSEIRFSQSLPVSVQKDGKSSHCCQKSLHTNQQKKITLKQKCLL
jgi:hypothetical protein